MSKKKHWSLRKPVQDCEAREWIDCPRCGLDHLCTALDADGFTMEEECCEENCPRFNKKTGCFRKVKLDE